MALATAAVVLVILYAVFDPALTPWVPRCLFHELTGLECPGCGTQRALHALLHGDIAEAWRFNALMVAALPLLGVMAYATLTRTRHPRLYARVNSLPVIIICGTAITAWFAIRNFIL